MGTRISARTGWRAGEVACRILVIGVAGEQLQHGQREAGGLAGAGLGGAEQIAAREHHGNGLRLDGGGFGIALLGNSAEQLGRQAEILE